MSALTDIERTLETLAGKSVIDRARRGDLAGEPRDLPIRHHATGQVVAWIPRNMADGLLPVVSNGYVIGYYRDTPKGREHPMLSADGAVQCWCICGNNEQWVPVFDGDGRPIGARLFKVD